MTSCYKQQTSASQKQGVTVRKCGAPGWYDDDGDDDLMMMLMIMMLKIMMVMMVIMIMIQDNTCDVQKS